MSNVLILAVLTQTMTNFMCNDKNTLKVVSFANCAGSGGIAHARNWGKTHNFWGIFREFSFASCQDLQIQSCQK